MLSLVQYLDLILFLPEDESDRMDGDIQSLLMLLHLLQQFLALHLEVLFLFLPLLVVELVDACSSLELLLHAIHLSGEFGDAGLDGFLGIVEVGLHFLKGVWVGGEVLKLEPSIWKRKDYTFSYSLYFEKAMGCDVYNVKDLYFMK